MDPYSKTLGQISAEVLVLYEQVLGKLNYIKLLDKQSIRSNRRNSGATHR